MRALAAFALLIVMACTPVAPDSVAAPVAGGSSTPEAAACAADGGAIQPVCRMQTLQCVIAYSDAGQACRDGDDCQGDCRVDPSTPAGSAATGQCQATSDPCGCFANVEDGRAQAGLCVD